MKTGSGIHFSRPFIPVLISFAIGIILADSFPGYVILYSLSSAFCALLILIFLLNGSGLFQKIYPRFFKEKDKIIMAPLVLFASLGYISASGITDIDPENMTDLLNHTGDQKKTITGHVVSLPKIHEDASSFILEVTGIQGPCGDNGGRGRIMVYCQGMDNPPDPGEGLSFVSGLKPFKSFKNPGCFDYASHMLYEGVRARCYVKSDEIKYTGNTKNTLFIMADRFRLKAGNRISEVVPEEAPVLKALLTGDQTGISPLLREAFNRTGTGHLIAISGLNIGIIATFSFFLAKYALSFWPFILKNGLLNRFASFAAAVPVIFYGFVSGFEPSAQRAVAMSLVFLCAGIFSRENDIMNTLAASAFIILAIMPGSIFSISFRLSYVAVIFLLLSDPLLGKIDSMLENKSVIQKGLSWTFKSFTVSFFATIGTAPFVMHYFGFLSPVGIPANLILIPLLGMAAVAPGLIAVSVLGISDVLFDTFIKTAAIPVRIGTSIIESLSGFSFSTFQTISPDSMETLIIYSFLIPGIFLFNRKILEKKYEKSQIIHRLATGVFVISGIFLAADTAFCLKKRFYNEDLILNVLDVGQGNSAVLQLPGGKTMIVDGGGFYGGGRLDTGKDIIAPFLRRKKILKLDYMVLTHPDMDHLKGLIYVAEKFPPYYFLEGNRKGDSNQYFILKNILKKNGTEVMELSYPSEKIIINGTEIEILNPHEINVGRNSTNSNDSSLVMKISHKNKAILFTGDISKNAEDKIVGAASGKLKSDVLMAPHHGSDGSCSESFLKAVDPDIAIISSGRKHFPGKQSLERLRERDINVFRTDIGGCVTVVNSDEGFEVKVFNNVRE